jgi:hypothetical protein
MPVQAFAGAGGMNRAAVPYGMVLNASMFSISEPETLPDAVSAIVLIAIPLNYSR